MKEEKTWAVYRSAWGVYDAFPYVGERADIDGKILSQCIERLVTRSEAERIAKSKNKGFL